MKIAILGTGRVGGTLGRKWAQAGHAVVFGTRDAGSDKVRALVAEVGHGAVAAGHREAVATADVILLAVPWAEGSALVQSLGDLTGKVLIDATNPVAPNFQLAVSGNTSAAEELAKVTTAHVVKAFNSTGSTIMANPEFPAGRAAMLVAGDNEDAKAHVLQLAADAGFQPEDAGPLRAARFLEPMALLWISMANRYGREKLAFTLLHR